MIVEVDCENCYKNCCKHSIVNINALDLAKILHTIKDYEFRDVTIKKRGFGAIYYKGKPLIIINEPLIGPDIHLRPPCRFLNNKGLCSLHDLLINNDSVLGKKLEKRKAPMNIKPMICRHHPYFYDTETGTVMKFKHCNEIELGVEKTSFEKKEMIMEMMIAEKTQTLLHNEWKKTRNYPIVRLAETMIRKDF